MLIKYNNCFILLKDPGLSRLNEEYYFIYYIQKLDIIHIQQYFKNFFVILNLFVNNKNVKIFIDCYSSGHYDLQVGAIGVGKLKINIKYDYLNNFFNLIVNHANKI